MSQAFRELLKKVGSGPHTSEDLTREESAAATRMMLLQEATPAQIGAFMISHRIKRPTGAELAGMLDAYAELGPVLKPIEAAHPVTVMCLAYDGRSRTAPISPLIALMLASEGIPVVQHGGDRMPTKAGVPLIELWNGLGVHWERLSLAQVETVLERTQLGFVYLPTHFPLAQGLVQYREEIGKRPPFSTLELMWSPYEGDRHVVCGFVHPPTEGMIQEAFALRGTERFTTVKGLEGSCDLPCDRTAIIGYQNPSSEFTRLHLVPREFGFAAKELPIASTLDLITEFKSVLQGELSPFLQATVWNGGFYLWRCGVCPDLETGFDTAKELLRSQKITQKLQQVIEMVDTVVDAMGTVAS